MIAACAISGDVARALTRDIGTQVTSVVAYVQS